MRLNNYLQGRYGASARNHYEFVATSSGPRNRLVWEGTYRSAWFDLDACSDIFYLLKTCSRWYPVRRWTWVEQEGCKRGRREENYWTASEGRNYRPLNDSLFVPRASVASLRYFIVGMKRITMTGYSYFCLFSRWPIRIRWFLDFCRTNELLCRCPRIWRFESSTQMIRRVVDS